MKKGVLLVNMGSPESPEKKDVKRYLNEFLTDKYVIDIPLVARHILVKAIIVPFRSSKSSAMYKTIWQSDGSPLIIHSKSLKNKIKEKLTEKEVEIPIEIGMRYGNPSIVSSIERLKKEGVTDILLIPMYPQYAKSTFETALNKVREYLNKRHKDTSLTIIPPFYDHADYISSLERCFREQMTGRTIDTLLFSFHGLPLKHLPCSIKRAIECNNNWSGLLDKKDECMNCYRYQCYKSASLLSANIGADEHSYKVSFQSRLGREEWLKPYTKETIKNMATDGLTSIAVIAPSFTADCLETLYELDIEMKNIFIENNGKEFYRINCLNDNELWVKKLSKWIIEWNDIKII